jgi:hypothetical protein
MKRTAGSTRDYLRWLEEVDLIEARKKRYTISAPLLRLWLRLYGRGTPPAERDIRDEVETYVDSLLVEGRTPVTPGAKQTVAKQETEKMIEID